MYYLILETSSPRGLCAIVKNGEVLFQAEVPFGVRDSGELVPVFEMGFKKINKSIKDIQTIILGIGPGSFTGLRIGASVAKAISFAQSIPITTVSSLKVFNPPKEGHFGVLLDIKGQGLQLQKGYKDLFDIHYEDQTYILTPQDIEIQLQGLQTLVTAHSQMILPKLPTEDLKNKLIEIAPDPIQMVKLAQKQPLSKSYKATYLMEINYFSTASF